MEQWYAFKAYNQKTLYGFGTAQQSDAYADRLNIGREVKHYAPYPLDKDQVDELKLDDTDLGFDLDQALDED